MAASALLCAALSTACAEMPPAVEIRTVRQNVPAALLSCPEHPVPPEAPDDHAVAAYVLALAEAGEDCRSKLARVRAVVATDQ